jgi:HSP20 family protein
MLSISCEKEIKHEPTNGDRYRRREYSYEAFERSFHLPRSVVDENKIKAEYDNGILSIRIPKREEAKKEAPRMIDIK